MNDREDWRLTLADVVAGVGAIPSLPAALIELMSAIDREDADPGRIARKLAQDQGVATRTLRVANPPF